LEELQWREQKKKEEKHVKDGDKRFQEDLNIMGINKRKTMVRDRRGWREIALEATVYIVLWRVRRRRGEEEEEQEKEEDEEEVEEEEEKKEK